MSNLISREEAIKILSQCGWDGLPHGYTGGYREALDMAIEALENYDGVAEALNGSVELYRKLKEKYDNLADNLIKKIKQLELLNNKDCPEWVINIIKGEGK